MDVNINEAKIAADEKRLNFTATKNTEESSPTDTNNVTKVPIAAGTCRGHVPQGRYKNAAFQSGDHVGILG
jgi:hypothetical protein